MWILECEGGVLSGCKLWLKPGSEYVIGRSANAAVNLVIPIKSISRLHLKIKVGDVPGGNGFKALSRSKITLEGQETMYGTWVDDEALGSGECKILSGTEHNLKLAKCEHNFRITWQPIIFSFSLSTKEKKDKKIMAGRQSKVEKYDIKTLETFVPSTTHVVASKRNTAIGLQALVNGRYIVTEDYLNAVAKVCQASDGGKSPLEDDFEKNWPNPMDYVPASSNEPNPREREYFAPKAERQTIFEGWSIVFCEQVQYENFLGPITDGGGKLERFDLVPGETTARKLIDFVEKRDTGNTAIVRFRGKGDNEDWYARLSTEVSEILNLRMVEQNEFLDIILTCDTLGLRRPLEEETTVHGDSSSNIHKMRPPSLPNKGTVGSPIDDVTMDEASESAPAAKPEASQAPRRRLGLRKPPNKFEMLDLFSMPGDPLPAPQSSQFIPTSSIGETQYSIPEISQTVYDDSSRISPTQGQAQGSFIKTLATQSSRKRSIEPEDDDPDLMNKLFPGAAAMKKRRIQEEEEESARRADEDVVIAETPPPESAKGEVEAQAKSGPKSQAKGKKVKVENPILIAAREFMEEEEEKNKRREQERNQGPVDDEEISRLKGPSTEEIIEIKPRSIVMRVNAYGEDSDRWDPKWNGRANFKKFKKRLPLGREDVGSNIISVRGNVIIPLVEHKSGTGSLFAHDFPEESQSRLAASDPEPEIEEIEEIFALDSSRRNTRTQIPVSQPRGTQVDSIYSHTLSRASSNTLEGDVGSSSRAVPLRTKRPRPQDDETLKAPVEKRAKKFFLSKDDSEGSDEDGLGFTFKKRGRK